MIIKKLDWLSPPITLYFKGENQHSSIVSAILSVICYALVFASAVYYILEFVHRSNPKAYFFNRYIVDAGYFPINSSSMFNFIQIEDTITNEAIPFDFTVFRVVGFDDIYSDEYMNNPNILEKKNFWVYGYCNNITDTQGISNLVNFKYYEQSACIRKYYDVKKHQFFNTGEPGFRWPVIEKGCSNPNRTYYGIVIQRCDQIPEILKDQGPSCSNTEKIISTINNVSLKYQLVDHYADMLNYEMPFTKYFYEVTSAITNGVYIVNHLNFNPANMLTHNGLFFDNQVHERSYFFTQNEKHTIDKSVLSAEQTTNGCLIGIYFWMQNTLQYYERNYDRIQDVLSDIGGVSSIVVTIGFYINLLIHNYIIVLDTQELVLSRDYINLQAQDRVKKRPTIFRRVNEMATIKRIVKNNSFIDEEKNESSNSHRIIKDKNENENSKNNSENNLKLNLNKKDIFNSFEEESEGDKKEDDITQGNNQNSKILEGISKNHNSRNTSKIIKNEKKEENELFYKQIKGNNNKNNGLDDYENKPLEKQNFNWFKYIWYLICCGINDKKIAYYENFRAKLISEENIIQNYLDIYKLIKANNLKNIKI